MGFRCDLDRIGRFVGFDTEYVLGYKENRYDRYPLLPAWVSVVDMKNGKGRVVYDAKIYQDPDDVFRYNSWITGLYDGDLEDGKDLDEVTDDLDDIFSDRVVCVMAGKRDFGLVNLDMDDYEVEDISKNILSSRGQSISLARLVNHFYDEDIQDGPHSASTDAFYTLKLFTDLIKGRPRPIYLSQF